MDEFARLLTPKTKMVAAVHVSNALGTINPVEEITALAHRAGAVVLIDGSQAVPHMAVDVRAIGADFYVFTGHKVYGPMGIGVLYGREALLEAMPPFLGGGDMIRTVTFEGSTWNDLPYKFEAGTPDVAGVVGLERGDHVRAATSASTRSARTKHTLMETATDALLRLPGVHHHRPRAPEGRRAVVRHGRHPPARYRHDRRP